MNEHTQGIHNKISRIYFYCQKGLSLVNETRNAFFLIFAAYYGLRLNNLIWLVLMVLCVFPLLTLIGWYIVHYMSKVMEWLGVKHGTFYQVRQYAVYEEMLKELKDINNKLKVEPPPQLE